MVLNIIFDQPPGWLPQSGNLVRFMNSAGLRHMFPVKTQYLRLTLSLSVKCLKLGAASQLRAAIESFSVSLQLSVLKLTRKRLWHIRVRHYFLFECDSCCCLGICAALVVVVLTVVANVFEAVLSLIDQRSSRPRSNTKDFPYQSSWQTKMIYFS